MQLTYVCVVQTNCYANLDLSGHCIFPSLLPSLSFPSLSSSLSLSTAPTAQDNDNRVREVSHRAMQSCVGKVKSAMGPHLRSILGPWLAGMCDPYASAASAAQTAFSTVFTPEKQIDVLKFGFRVIISVSPLV